MSPTQKTNLYKFTEKIIQTTLENAPQLLEVKSNQDLFNLAKETVEKIGVTARNCQLQYFNGVIPLEADCDTVEKQNNFSSELCSVKSDNGDCIDATNNLELTWYQYLDSMTCDNNDQLIQTYKLKSNNDILDCPIGDFCKSADNRNNLKKYMLREITADPRCSV
jgi:hypothetical protein